MIWTTESNLCAFLSDVLDPEFIFSSILKQELYYDAYALKFDYSSYRGIVCDEFADCSDKGNGSTFANLTNDVH